jgi:hypothetical protein
MDFLNRYEQQKKEVLEAERLREQREAEERIRREERERMAQERITADAIEEAKEIAKQETIESFIPQDNGEEAKVFTYMVKLTSEQKKTFEMYMDSVGIEYFAM